MAKLPQVSGTDLVRVFKKDSWIVIRQKGSHIKLIKYLKQVGKSTIIIPQHKVLKKGTLARILKDSGVSIEKLKKLL